jgi:hypothetical protein
MNEREPNEFPDPEETREILFLMGLGLTSWERVEDEHFFLFRKLLDYQADQICSVLYHGPPTFESRRVLVDRLMEANVVPPDFKTVWRKINKRLATAANHRGQLAHFGLGFDVDYLDKEPSLKYRVINPHLRPSLNNRLKSMQGTGYENPKTRVSKAALVEYLEEFGALASELAEFRRTLIIGRLPRAERPRSEIPQRSLSKVVPLLIRRNKTQKDEPPSGK